MPLTSYHYGVVQSHDALLRTIGVAIRTQRRARKLSQEALAALAGLDRSYVSSVERGLRNVSVLNLARIAAALNTSVWDLFGSRADERLTPNARASRPIEPRQRVRTAGATIT
jgi:transcriptional regulator with XRE-family HTH domain